MSSYETRLAAFAEGRRLLRLRHVVKNRDNISCDACGSTEPRLLHVLKDDATGRYVFAGTNCLQALADLGFIRRRYASDLAEHAYDQELAHRQTDHEWPADAPEPPNDGVATVPPACAEAADAPPVLVAAVAVLQPGEWAALQQALGVGADRWRFVAIGEHAVGITELLDVPANHSNVSVET